MHTTTRSRKLRHHHHRQTTINTSASHHYYSIIIHSLFTTITVSIRHRHNPAIPWIFNFISKCDKSPSTYYSVKTNQIYFLLIVCVYIFRMFYALFCQVSAASASHSAFTERIGWWSRRTVSLIYIGHLPQTDRASAPKVLARVGGVVDPVKILLTSSLITVQNLVAVSHPVCQHVGGPRNWGTLWPSPFNGACLAP